MAQLLRKKGTDELYVYTALLAERGDMEVVAEDPVAVALAAPVEVVEPEVRVIDELEALLAPPKKRK